MQNKFSQGSIGMCAMVIMLGFTTQARSFEFKQFKSTGSKANSEYYWMGTEKSKSAWYRVKIGGASKIDDTSEMEIRAATVLKNVTDRKTGVNDIAKFKFDPINKGKPIYFMVSSGAAFMVERDNDYWYGGNDGRANKGWQLAGCIIEIWQKGKVVKHWSGAAGGGKTRLTDGIPLLRINRDGRPSETERFSRDFDNATKIFSVDEKGERVDIEDVLQPYREDEGDEKASAGKTSSAKAPAINAVASKLRQCDFLRNERFKRNAKFYLCLFSASWCPPCRAEMPRIAETYAETLKDDPDIELIHFSRDRDDEKAMAWAKEHNVKFPVVKPRGGNPLDLHTRGIPHLFIVKADGTVLEEGHPMRIFNEEKFRELKGGGATDGVKPQDDKAYAKRTVNGGDSPVSAKSRDYSKGEKGAATVDNITWSYSIQGGEATIVSPTGKLYERAVTPQPVGDIAIPPSVNGTPVTGIGKFALCNCSELASVRIPNSVKHIDEWAFSGCRKLTSVTVPSSVDNIGKCVFASCPRLVEINVEAGNSKYVAVDGVVYTRDMKRLVTGVGGLMSVNVPPGVEEIDREAFRCCRELKSVTMPLSVKTIGREAFLASGLESVIVPSSVSRIESWAFWCCTGLRSVTIHEGVAIIGNQAFYQCRNLKEVLVPTSVKYIEADAFKDCRELVSVTMSGERPDTRGSIFEKCDKLAAIHVSANAKSWAGMKEWQGIPLVFDAEAK